MKITYRILLINFAIVVLVLAGSAFAFYSIMYNVLASQQSKYLQNSANEFIYAYRELSQNAEDRFLYLAKERKSFDVTGEQDIDFILKGKEGGNLETVSIKNNVILPLPLTVDNFTESNPMSVISFYEIDGTKYYFGKIVTPATLTEISKKIKADVALIWDNSPAAISNESANEGYLYALQSAYKILRGKKNFEIYADDESADLITTIYKPSSEISLKRNAQFVIFTTIKEAADLRSNLILMLIITGLAGVTISLILSFIFTDRIRRHITLLSKATRLSKEGTFSNKISIKSKDEIGQLAGAFNNMIDEIERSQKIKNEYSEFITLLNQNPTLQQVSDAALKKIITTCNSSAGILYSVEDNEITLISTYGIDKDNQVVSSKDLFSTIIKEKEIIEIDFDQDKAIIAAGLFSIQLKHMLIIPVVYNSKLIAILQLCFIEKPAMDVKEYLEQIQDQLAIGLTNAAALLQLEKFVQELKRLNEDYQKQNIQIRKQNETLIDLHKKLKEKAEELEVQKEKAEESTKLKSQFLASMSHELRTPMNSILGLTELILDESTLSRKNKERISVVHKSGKRLMSLINDILDLSKIEAGKMEVHDENILLEELVSDIETSVSPLFINKQITFNIIRKTDTKVIINTDRGKVMQVLINLIANAVKFTEQGSVEVVVKAEEDSRLRFDVVDTGIGISGKDQDFIFEEFRQVDGTTTRKYSGTGLGLAICKKIANLLSGSISVKSIVGKGSSFTFIIPLKFVAYKELEPQINLNVESLMRNSGHPILVIDDDPTVQYTIGQYLTSRGYEVIYAGDGAEGLELAKQHQPFAITLDVMLPHKDGWTVLKELKEDPLTKDIPVILISIIGNKNLGYGLGAFEYFVKPISSEKLLSAFSRLENFAKKRIEKIVLVDDDELEYEKFKREFKDENVRINYIQDSTLAFNRIAELQPDLIILDLMMPGIDGVTLSYKLKSSVETKNIPIILSTSKDLSDEEKSELSSIVENITIKSKGHPLDVLKVVRDRISMQEKSTRSGSYRGEIKQAEEVSIVDETEIPVEYAGTVLIVDDDSETLFTINEIVELCGCKTILAKSGIEALRILESTTPDLILLDIMMPEMDGFQTIKNIKSNSRLLNIPVYAVTAKAMVEDKAIILKHGFDDYVSKPVNPGVLAFKVKRTLIKMNL